MRGQRNPFINLACLRFYGSVHLLTRFFGNILLLINTLQEKVKNGCEKLNHFNHFLEQKTNCFHVFSLVKKTNLDKCKSSIDLHLNTSQHQPLILLLNLFDFRSKIHSILATCRDKIGVQHLRERASSMRLEFGFLRVFQANMRLYYRLVQASFAPTI